jgi:hypothetical protein
MQHYLYSKPAFPRPWERDRDQKNERPVIYARDEQHAEQLRGRMNRRQVNIEINAAVFTAGN